KIWIVMYEPFLGLGVARLKLAYLIMQSLWGWLGALVLEICGVFTILWGKSINIRMKGWHDPY
ncbi:hypothetical protein ACJX0J_034701, partial [Zea mays]